MFGIDSFGELQAVLGRAVLQFLWQGAAIGLAAAGALAFVSKRNAPARYAVSCAALAACFVTFVATASLSAPRTPAPLTAEELAALLTFAAADENGAGDASALVAELTPAAGTATDLLAWIWAAGVLLMSLRVLRGGLWARRLRADARPPDDESWQDVFSSLCAELGLRRSLRLMQSATVDSPVVVGWIAPLVLVPVSTFTALTPEQLRCILAHELAHIRRHDHLVNALQALVEVCLFFHPATWWLSKVIREEREHCCDVVAVRATGSPLLLARALTRLEALRLACPSAALAARSTKGPLMQRISRLLDSPDTGARAVGGHLRAVLATGALLLGVGVAQAAVDTPLEEAAAVAQDRDAETDYRVIERRILAAVKQGALSEDTAAQTLVALRKSMFGGGSDRPERSKPAADLEARKKKYEAFMREVEAEVRSGRISKADAEKRLVGARKKLFPDADAPRESGARQDARRKYTEAEAKIKAAVKEGKLSREEAGKRLEEYRRQLAQDEPGQQDVRKRYAELRERLEAAVQSGRMTKEQARDADLNFRKQLGEDTRAEKRRDPRAEAERVWKELEEGVKAGDITREQAAERMEGYRRRAEAEAFDRRMKEAEESKRRDPKADFESLERRIEEAVKSGEMTKEEARKTLESLKKRSAARERRKADR